MPDTPDATRAASVARLELERVAAFRKSICTCPWFADAEATRHNMRCPLWDPIIDARLSVRVVNAAGGREPPSLDCTHIYEPAPERGGACRHCDHPRSCHPTAAPASPRAAAPEEPTDSRLNEAVREVLRERGIMKERAAAAPECPFSERVRQAAERLCYHNNPNMQRAAIARLMEAVRIPCPRSVPAGPEPHLELTRLADFLVKHYELWPAMSGSPVDIAIVLLSKLAGSPPERGTAAPKKEGL